MPNLTSISFLLRIWQVLSDLRDKETSTIDVIYSSAQPSTPKASFPAHLVYFSLKNLRNSHNAVCDGSSAAFSGP